MKLLISPFIILCLSFSSFSSTFALDVKEKIDSNDIKITLTFTKAEWDLFILDKANPKEWIRNACSVNFDYQNRAIDEELYKGLIFNTPENKSKKVKEKKDNRNKKIQEQIDKGDTEAVVYN